MATTQRIVINKILLLLMILVSPNWSTAEWIQISPLSKPSYIETVTSAYKYQTFGTVATTENLLDVSSLYNTSHMKKSQHKIQGIKNYENSGFLPYIENIQGILMKNSHATIKNKINVLKNLKDDLFFNIKEKMSNLWQQQSRQARVNEDYQMDFPSNEGALMTIGFLTFAVFLIKLVLKLIHALKNKRNGNVPSAVIPTAIGRKKLDVSTNKGTKILHLIDDFKFK